jgi:hypothetical protein
MMNWRARHESNVRPTPQESCAHSDKDQKLGTTRLVTGDIHYQETILNKEGLAEENELGDLQLSTELIVRMFVQFTELSPSRIRVLLVS